jgi:MinD superfamily P-loop ATPase
MRIIEEQCDQCGECLGCCSEDAIIIDGISGAFSIDDELCTDCKICLDFDCPGGAICE